MAKKKTNMSVSHDHWSIVLLRLGMGWVFTYAGWSKVVTFFTDAPNWTAAGYLKHIEGPFGEAFSPLIGNIWVDYLNAYGLLLIGIAMLLGILVRWSAWWGAILMFLYWLTDYPPAHSFIIDDHLIYLVVFIVLATVDAGRTLGVDGYIEQSGLVKQHPWLKIFLG